MSDIDEARERERFEAWARTQVSPGLQDVWLAAKRDAASQAAQREEDRRDAERYRTLREYEVDSYIACGKMEKLDVEIDREIAARAAGAQGDSNV